MSSLQSFLAVRLRSPGIQLIRALISSIGFGGKGMRESVDG
ncbi:MAG: hypothetical protein U5N58_13955 [Actinomycetota bacterium]|nr:hypothetical protein [Actinomycetota bacterium]